MPGPRQTGISIPLREPQCELVVGNPYDSEAREDGLTQWLRRLKGVDRVCGHYRTELKSGIFDAHLAIPVEAGVIVLHATFIGW